MSNRILVASSFLAGFTVASIIRIFQRRQVDRKNRANAGAGSEGTDFSLFWDTQNASSTTKPNSDSATSYPIYDQFLPSDFYRQLVQTCILTCVDCVIVRYNKLTQSHQCLLVERASDPVKGVWWLPGGRLFKGETFFEGALRKAKEETGLANVEAKQVLGVYNTFFPTSAWDTEEEKGTQTVNAIVLVDLKYSGDGENNNNDVLLDKTSERYRWIGLDPEEAKKNGEDRYVIEALMRLQSWNSTYGSKE